MESGVDRGEPDESSKVSPRGDDRRRHIELLREDISVARKITHGDTVKVSTITRVREVPIEEMLLQERVEIDRIPIGREVLVAPDVTHDGDLTIIPILKEVFVVQRKLILEEEIHVRRIRTEAQHSEVVAVREQEAIITRVSKSGGVGDIPPGSQSLSTTGEPV